MSTTYVNIFGAPCSGKSTVAAGLFYHLKRAGHSVELVTEYAKDLVYEEDFDTLNNYQDEIFVEQLSRVRRLKGKVQFAVVDSPLILSAVYHVINASSDIPSTLIADEFTDYVAETFKNYNNINIYLRREMSPYNIEGRVHTAEQSAQIDKLIRNTMYRYDVPYFEVKNQTGVIDKIIEIIGQQYMTYPNGR